MDGWLDGQTATFGYTHICNIYMDVAKRSHAIVHPVYIYYVFFICGSLRWGKRIHREPRLRVIQRHVPPRFVRFFWLPHSLMQQIQNVICYIKIFKYLVFGGPIPVWSHGSQVPRSPRWCGNPPDSGDRWSNWKATVSITTPK
jgi:hypothetical protein